MLSQVGGGPSGRQEGEEEFDSEEIEVVYSEPEAALGKVELVVESHPREGILLRNLKSKVINDELKMLRYLYNIPHNVEVRAPEVYERIDWVVPGWVALYDLMFKDGMRLSILKLIRDVCDHYEIAPSQLMPNAWSILIALESLSV